MKDVLKDKYMIKLGGGADAVRGEKKSSAA